MSFWFYLKANGIKDGLTNYDKILTAFKAWKKSPWIEVKTKLNWRPLSHYNWSILNRSSFIISSVISCEKPISPHFPKGDANIFCLELWHDLCWIKGRFEIENDDVGVDGEGVVNPTDVFKFQSHPFCIVIVAFQITHMVIERVNAGSSQISSLSHLRPWLSRTLRALAINSLYLSIRYPWGPQAFGKVNEILSKYCPNSSVFSPVSTKTLKILAPSRCNFRSLAPLSVENGFDLSIV